MLRTSKKNTSLNKTMKKLTTIALLLLGASLAAQEAENQEAPSTDQVVPVADDEVMTVVQPPPMTPDEELTYEYERYLSLMRDGVYDEADSVAKRVVELAIKVKGPRSSYFANALTNLAIVQHRTQQFDAAQQNFESAIEIIEDNEDQLNAQLVNPLRGLGASQLEAGRPDKASATFRRAVHVSHVNEGPHNLEQIVLLESLSETHLRVGAIEDAKKIQDRVYALNERAFANDAMGMIPSLMRRADWQHRAGFINDQRATLRRAVRIIETVGGKDDMRLVEPLTELGQSFFYIDTSGIAYAQTTLATGETHFKRALRIASANPDENWQMIAETTLSLGDYYNFLGNMQQANKIYMAAWQDLEKDEARQAYRREHLENFVALRENRLPDVVTPPSGERVPTGQEIPLSQGSITLRYDVSSRGRPVNLKIVEAQPQEFVDMHRKVQRELRRRIYRPRYTADGPVATEDLVINHKYFFQQAELEALRAPPPPETEET